MRNHNRTRVKRGRKPKAEAGNASRLGSVTLAQGGRWDLRTSDVHRIVSSINSLASSHSISEQRCQSGAQIGKYVVQRILGCHGQATVLLVKDPQLKRRAVLKLYHVAISGQHRVRMINEGRALARIQDPHVAACFGVEEGSGLFFLVIEYVKGKSLCDLLNDRSLSPEAALRIVRQIALGLKRVHEVGLLHRDIKPSNVMVTPDQRVKVIDFGLVQATNSTGNGDVSGTPAYMAPELLAAEPAEFDARSDLFGLGAILYEMLTGHPPFAASTRSESRQLAKRGNIQPVRELCPSISVAMNDLCMRCLARDPNGRPQSADEVIELIDQVAIRGQKRMRLKAMTLVCGALAVMTGVVYWFMSPGDPPGLVPVSAHVQPEILQCSTPLPLVGRGGTATQVPMDDGFSIQPRQCERENMVHTTSNDEHDVEMWLTMAEIQADAGQSSDALVNLMRAREIVDAQIGNHSGPTSWDRLDEFAHRIEEKLLNLPHENCGCPGD